MHHYEAFKNNPVQPQQRTHVPDLAISNKPTEALQWATKYREILC